MATARTTADIKRFTGFIAPDGSTHDTLKKATDHTRELKIKEALQQFANIEAAVDTGVSHDDRDNTVVFADDMPSFLFAHQEAILAAFNQEVLLRKKREPKPKAVKPAVEGSPL